MLVYEDCRHEESTPQVRALVRAFKKSSEGRHLNKLIREKNVDGFLPRSVGAYMNAAEGLVSEADAALRKARKYTDAAGGKLSAPVTGTKRINQSASIYKPKCPGCGGFDHGYKECVYRIHPYFNTDPSIEYAKSTMGLRYYNKYGGGTSKNETWIIPCTRTIEVGVCSESGCARRILLRCQVNLLVESGLCLEVESPLSTVAAIPRAEQNRSRIFRLTSAIAALVRRTRTPVVRISTIDVARQRARTTADKTMPKNEIATRTTARKGNGIGTADPSATKGVVVETLRRGSSQ